MQVLNIFSVEPHILSYVYNGEAKGSFLFSWIKFMSQALDVRLHDLPWI